jgi:hypothetical protein
MMDYIRNVHVINIVILDCFFRVSFVNILGWSDDYLSVVASRILPERLCQNMAK